MHPQQAQAIDEVVLRADKLSDLVMRVCGCEEDVALDTIQAIPDIVNRLQDNDMKGLLVEAVKKVAPQELTVYRPPDPPAHEYYPGHPKFHPLITTKDAFNAHVAQAMAPYVKAIVDRVARDRELASPDLKTVEALLEKTDWARAAYEAKQMPSKPPPGKIHQFFKKYLFTPLDKLTDKAPLAAFWGFIGAGQILLILWTVFGGTIDRIERAGAPMKLYNTRSRRQQEKAFQRFSKKTGIPWTGDGVY